MPAVRAWPALTVRSVVPSAEILSFTCFCAPRPSATTAITAATPMTMPSIVNSDRSLFARSAPSATRRVSAISMGLVPPSRSAATTTRRAAAQRAHRALHLVVLRLALGLKRGGTEHRDLVSLLQSVADDFSVVVVGYAEADGLSFPCGSLLHEHEAGARTRTAVALLAEAAARATTTARTTARTCRCTA